MLIIQHCKIYTMLWQSSHIHAHYPVSLKLLSKKLLSEEWIHSRRPTLIIPKCGTPNALIISHQALPLNHLNLWTSPHRGLRVRHSNPWGTYSIRGQVVVCVCHRGLRPRWIDPWPIYWTVFQKLWRCWGQKSWCVRVGSGGGIGCRPWL